MIYVDAPLWWIPCLLRECLSPAVLQSCEKKKAMKLDLAIGSSGQSNIPWVLNAQMFVLQASSAVHTTMEGGPDT